MRTVKEIVAMEIEEVRGDFFDIMSTVKEIVAMGIEEVRADFFDIMSTVVTTYGDDQEETSEQEDENVSEC